MSFLWSTKTILNFIFLLLSIRCSDVIKICKDLGNNIPDKSWMLYLLELFDSGAIDNIHRAIELNLICQFNEYDNFWAIFAGVNRYKFNKVLPVVGHSYLIYAK